MTRIDPHQNVMENTRKDDTENSWYLQYNDFHVSDYSIIWNAVISETVLLFQSVYPSFWEFLFDLNIQLAMIVGFVSKPLFIHFSGLYNEYESFLTLRLDALKKRVFKKCTRREGVHFVLKLSMLEALPFLVEIQHMRIVRNLHDTLTSTNFSLAHFTKSSCNHYFSTALLRLNSFKVNCFWFTKMVRKTIVTILVPLICENIKDFWRIDSNGFKFHNFHAYY